MLSSRGWRLTAAGAVIVLAVIQLVPVNRGNPPTGLEVEASPEVRQVLERACWDCHSNQTRWPWYAHVAPASWLLSYHVHEGREHINFTEWPLPGFDEQTNRELVWKQVDQGKMPPWSYRLLHPEARLNERDKELLRDWSAAGPVFDLDPLLGGS